MTELERMEMARATDNEFNTLVNDAEMSLLTIDDAISKVKRYYIGTDLTRGEIVERLKELKWIDTNEKSTFAARLENWMRDVVTEIEYPEDLYGEGAGGCFTEIETSYITASGFRKLMQIMKEME